VIKYKRYIIIIDRRIFSHNLYITYLIFVSLPMLGPIKLW